MSEPVLKVSGLGVGVAMRQHGQPVPILEGVSFDLAPRSVLGVIGESGSGKTILSKALVNWIRPPLRITGGSVIYRGRDLLSRSPAEMQKIRGREIAYVGANPGGALDPTVPVGHQILEKLLTVEPGLSRAEARRRVIETLDAVRIPSAGQRFDEYPFQFSGGMMQRALIVDALVSNPVFLVADNITQPLDVTVAAQILRLLRDLQKEYETAIIFISSSLGTVAEIADDVLVLQGGRVAELQPVRKLLDAPAHAYTMRLIEKVPRIWAAASGPDAGPEAAGADLVLDVRDAVKTYRVRDRRSLFRVREVKAVRGVSFDVRRGENFGIIGESGCGKSTLSRLLSRLEPPDSGRILFKGEDMARMRRSELLRVRSRFQLLLQDPFNAVPAHFQIGRTLSEPLRIHGSLGTKAIRARVLDVMREVGLELDLYHQLPVGLSAGQRQRVNIARAMVLEPELLILDETLSALDQVEQARLLDLFEDLQKRHGITYVYISHDLAMVRRVCTRIAVMYLGRIVELADNHSTFFDSGHPYTRALLSAVPAIEPRPYATDTYLLEGEPPSPVDIPSGCSFRPRCPFAYQRCSVDDPPLYARNRADSSACHLVQDRPELLADAALAERRRATAAGVAPST